MCGLFYLYSIYCIIIVLFVQYFLFVYYCTFDTCYEKIISRMKFYKKIFIIFLNCVNKYACCYVEIVQIISCISYKFVEFIVINFCSIELPVHVCLFYPGHSDVVMGALATNNEELYEKMKYYQNCKFHNAYSVLNFSLTFIVDFLKLIL